MIVDFGANLYVLYPLLSDTLLVIVTIYLLFNSKRVSFTFFFSSFHIFITMSHWPVNCAIYIFFQPKSINMFVKWHAQSIVCAFLFFFYDVVIFLSLTRVGIRYKHNSEREKRYIELLQTADRCFVNLGLIFIFSLFFFIIRSECSQAKIKKSIVSFLRIEFICTQLLIKSIPSCSANIEDVFFFLI